MTHWKKNFFQYTIPGFVKEGLLDSSCICSGLQANENDNQSDNAYVEGGAAGVVYLPFSLHSVSRVIAAYKEISECYTISFMRKAELSENALW